MDELAGKVFCSLCGEWVYPIYGGQCSNCGEDIPDYDGDDEMYPADADEEDEIDTDDEIIAGLMLDNIKHVLNHTAREKLQDELEYFMRDFADYGNEAENEDMLDVFAFITDDGYDIYGFGLNSIPTPSVYEFCNKEENQKFDICINHMDGNTQKTYASYLDKDGNRCCATSIAEAIEKYGKSL